MDTHRDDILHRTHALTHPVDSHLLLVVEADLLLGVAVEEVHYVAEVALEPDLDMVGDAHVLAEHAYNPVV